MHRTAVIVVVLAISFFCGPRVKAQTSSEIDAWLGLSLGYSYYSMDDVDNRFHPYSSNAISKGNNWGGQAGILVNWTTRLGINYRKFNVFDSMTEEPVWDLIAHTIYGSIDYVPEIESQMRPGFGASIGMLWNSNMRMGMGSYIDIHFTIDLALGTQAALVPQLGYRYSKLTQRGNRDFSVDYSGFMINVSLIVFGESIRN